MVRAVAPLYIITSYNLTFATLPKPVLDSDKSPEGTTDHIYEDT